MKLESFVSGRWISGAGQARALVDPVTGETIAEADSAGLGLAAAMDFARGKGGLRLQMQRSAIRGSTATFERLAGDANEATL